MFQRFAVSVGPSASAPGWIVCFAAIIVEPLRLMTAPEPFFKGWAKPGPVPPGALSGTLAVEPGETLDAISGHFRLFQLADGHRFSTDDVLTAWYGTSWCPAARRVLGWGQWDGHGGHYRRLAAAGRAFCDHRSPG